MDRICPLAAAQNQPGRAAHLFGAAEALRERIHVDMLPAERREYDAEVTGLRIKLEEAGLVMSWTEGRGMDIDQAIALASTNDGSLGSR